VRNLSRYINETGACITNNKFNKQNDASFIRGEGKKTYTSYNIIPYTIPARRDPSDKNQTAYCVVDGVGIVFKQKNYTTWRGRCCVCVCVLISSEKKCIPKSYSPLHR